MVEAFAVASEKDSTGKATSTLTLGMALAEEHDVTVRVDSDDSAATHDPLSFVEVSARLPTYPG